ncbi:MAG: DUF3127 domain-containing protein [Candidatus Absconditabacterales bacterium]|jgi:hypothetical protein
MQYTGTVKVIGPKEEVGANALIKQTMVLEENTDREFKGGLAVDFFKEKTELLDGVKVGDMVTAYLNTRVNESKTQAGRFFNSISCWKLEKGEGTAPSNKAGAKDDDLPF